MYWIRLAASVYALVTSLNLAGQWWYANMPVKQGGARLNPFNDPRLVPCLYSFEGGGGKVCTLRGMHKPLSRDEMRKHAHTQWRWIAFMGLHLLALACFGHERWAGDNTGGQGSLQNGVVVGVAVLLLAQVLKPKMPILK